MSLWLVRPGNTTLLQNIRLSATSYLLTYSKCFSVPPQLRYWSWQAMQPETTRKVASHRVTSCLPSPTTRSWTRSAAAHPRHKTRQSWLQCRQHENVGCSDTFVFYSVRSCLWSPLVAPKRRDHCSGRSPAQHPPGAPGQEEGSKGETGDSSLARSWEEAQGSQENGGQEDEWEKGRRKGQGAAQLVCLCVFWLKQKHLLKFCSDFLPIVWVWKSVLVLCASNRSRVKWARPRRQTAPLKVLQATASPSSPPRVSSWARRSESHHNYTHTSIKVWVRQ